MDGSRSRLVVALVALLLAACDARPVATTAQGQPSRMPGSTPGATRKPPLTPAPTVALTPPTSVDLPAGFGAIAWANVASSPDADEFVVSYGVLGQQEFGSKSYSSQPSVSASGSAILVETDAATQIIDARTGATIGQFHRDDLHLSLEGMDPNDLAYSYVRQFGVDVEHGYLYDMSANRSGLQLRRFDLHGEHPTVLATLAPDPGKDFWVSVDFEIADDGSVVATSCPSPESPVADHRCRLYQIPLGVSDPVEPRYLPANSPRPCGLLAADTQFLIGSVNAGCRADGGVDQFLQYMALDLETLQSMLTLAPSDFEGGRIEYLGNDVGPLPALVANLYPRATYGSPYPAIAVWLEFGDARFAVERYDWLVEDPFGLPNPYADYAWAIRGHGAGWTLFHGYGPDFAQCAAGASFESPPACASGPEILLTPAGRFELPPGTWGEVVPPFGSPAL